MKRDARLQPLSRDHHEALVLARALRWAAEDDPRAPRDPLALLRGAWGETIESHFDEEEQLLPPLMRADDAVRFRREHAALRALSAELLGGAAGAARLTAFASQLHDHIKWEEAELFPHIEADAPAEVLDAIGRRLEVVEAERLRELD